MSNEKDPSDKRAVDPTEGPREAPTEALEPAPEVARPAVAPAHQPKKGKSLHRKIKEYLN